MSLDTVAFPIHTERLLLRRLRPDDADAVWRLRSDPAVGRWLATTWTDRDAFDEALGGADWQSRTIVIEHDGELIGDLYAHRQDEWAQFSVSEQAKDAVAAIGWTMLPSAQGRGFAFEAASELLRICFEDLGVRRVYAECFTDNEPSWRLMEKLQMRREACHVENSLHAELGWLDCLIYALLASEWRGFTAPGGESA